MSGCGLRCPAVALISLVITPARTLPAQQLARPDVTRTAALLNPVPSREAAIAHNGLVLTGELDDNSMLYDAAAADVAPASGPSPTEVFPDRGPGDAGLSGGGWYAGVDVVGS